MTTKPRGPHPATLERYGFLIGDLLRQENGAALFFPELRESAIKTKLAARAAGLKFQQSDEVEAGVIRRCADDPKAFLMWIRRNSRLVRKMIRAAKMETPARAATRPAFGITIHQDRNQREQHSANAR